MSKGSIRLMGYITEGQGFRRGDKVKVKMYSKWLNEVVL